METRLPICTTIIRRPFTTSIAIIPHIKRVGKVSSTVCVESCFRSFLAGQYNNYSYFFLIKNIFVLLQFCLLVLLFPNIKVEWEEGHSCLTTLWELQHF